MTGTVSWNCCVISSTMTMAIIGACVTAASTEAIPTMASTRGSPIAAADSSVDKERRREHAADRAREGRAVVEVDAAGSGRVDVVEIFLSGGAVRRPTSAD